VRLALSGEGGLARWPRMPGTNNPVTRGGIIASPASVGCGVVIMGHGVQPKDHLRNGDGLTPSAILAVIISSATARPYEVDRDCQVRRNGVPMVITGCDSADIDCNSW